MNPPSHCLALENKIYLECSLCLINTPTNGKIVNGGVLDHSFLVNDEKSP
jgi:hypothetical protein